MKKKNKSLCTVSYLSANVVKEVTGQFLTFMPITESTTMMVLLEGKNHTWINLESIIMASFSNPPPLIQLGVDNPMEVYVQ